MRSLEPIKDATNERRDEESTGLSSSDGLDGREHERQVAVDAVLGLQDLGSLDTLVGGSDLDENAALIDAELLVQVNDVQSLADRLLGVVREGSVDFGGDLAGDDLEDAATELNQETVEGVVDLLIDGGALNDSHQYVAHLQSPKSDNTYLVLAVRDSGVDELSVRGVLSRSEDQRRVGGSILRLVLGNGYVRLVSRSQIDSLRAGMATEEGSVQLKSPIPNSVSNEVQN